MTMEKFEEAVQNLTFMEVILKSAVVENNLNVNGHHELPLEMTFQTYGDVTGFGETTLSPKEEGNEDEYEYIYITSLGQRLVKKEDNDELIVLAEVKAEFVAVYSAERKLDQECLEAFGEKNVMFNVWPFWREYVHSQCQRMGIKPFPVKFLRSGKIDSPASNDIIENKAK